MKLVIHIADPELRADLASALRLAGHQVSQASDLEAALEDERADAHLVDLVDGEGLARLAALRRDEPDLGLLAIGGDAEPRGALEALRAGADSYLRRPFDVERLERALATATRRARRGAADAGLVARDPRSRRLVRQLELAAQSDATLLLAGPSGSGRTRLARFVHDSSPRAAGPLVEVDCASLNPAEAQALLFGRREGSDPGRLRAAHRGTLLLEGIADLPQAVQAPLLHAIQERRVRPVGARRSVTLDLRIMATAGPDLAERVEAGGLRRDLRLRLGVIEVEVPALRQRPDDVPPLALLFLERAARASGGPAAVLAPETLRELRERPFPGNLHELDALMRRANSIYRGVPLRAEDLDAPIAAPGPAQAGAGFNLRRLERETIARSLRAAGGNRTAAARALGISTRTLRNKLRRYQLT